MSDKPTYRHRDSGKSPNYTEVLQRVQQEVDTALDLQEVLDRILMLAVESVGARDGTLMLVDPSGELHFRARFGRSLPEGKTERAYEPGEGIAGWVLQTRSPYVCRDTRTDSLFVPIIAGAQIRSLVSVPITSHGAVLGVVNIDSPEPNHFSDADAALLVALAGQTAKAIERAELLNSVREISEKTLSGAGDLYQAIVDAIYRLTQSPVAMWQVDPTNNTQATIIAYRNIRNEYASNRIVNLETSIVGESVRTAAIAIAADMQDDPRVSAETKAEAALCGWKSMIVVPLFAQQGHATGVLSIYSSAEKEFTRWKTDLLLAYAGQASVALQNAARLQVIREVSDTVSSVSDLKEVGEEILDELKRVVDYQTASMQLIRGDTRTLIAGRGFDDRASTEWLLRPISQDHLLNRVVAARKPLVLSYPSEDPDWSVRAETANVRSWVGLPLVHSDRVIGLLTLAHDRPGFYSPAIEDFLALFANQAAIAISNAGRTVQLIRLQEVTTAISTQLAKPSGLTEVTRLIVNGLSSIFPGASCAVRLYDSKNDQFEAVVANGLREVSSRIERQPRSDGTSRSVISRRLPRYLEEDALLVPSDGGTAPREEVLQAGVKAVAYLPLISEADVVGILYVDFTTPHRFSFDDKRILKLFADQAAIAIKQARLYNERVKDIAAFQEINSAITTKSWKQIAELIAQTARELTQAEYSGLWVVDQKKPDRLVLGAMYGEGPMDAPELGIDAYSIPGWVAMNEKAYVCFNVRDDPHYRMWRESVQSSAAAPMMLRGQVIGTLNIESSQPQAFSEYQLGLLQSLADQAAIAIQNARLYEHTSHDLKRRIRELEVLSGIYEKIIRVGIESVDRVLDLIYTETCKVMDLTDAQVQFAFYDERRDEVTFPLAIEQDDGQTIDVIRWGRRESQYRQTDEAEVVEAFKPRLRGTRFGLTEYVISTRKPVWIAKDFEKKANALRVENSNVRVLPMFGRLQRPVLLWLGVPMIVQGHIIGVISIQSLEKEHAFDQGHVDLLSTVADQAAVAIENARLYQEARSEVIAAKQLAALGTAMAALQHRINNTFNVIVPNITRLRNRVDTSDKTIVEILDIIERNARYTSDIIARIQKPLRETEIQEVDINAILNEVAARMKEKWDGGRSSSHISVSLALDDSIPYIQAPIGQLTEVFWNLLDNACRAMMNRGGEIVVSSRMSDTSVCVRVHDTGPGIPPAIQQRLFEKPVPSREPGGGAGLGLWLSRLMLHSIGGNIMIESTGQGGTTMLVQLPVSTTS